MWFEKEGDAEDGECLDLMSGVWIGVLEDVIHCVLEMFFANVPVGSQCVRDELNGDDEWGV